MFSGTKRPCFFLFRCSELLDIGIWNCISNRLRVKIVRLDNRHGHFNSARCAVHSRRMVRLLHRDRQCPSAPSLWIQHSSLAQPHKLSGHDRLGAALDRALELGLLAISSFPTHPCLIQFHASPPHTQSLFLVIFSHDVDDGSPAVADASPLLSIPPSSQPTSSSVSKHQCEGGLFSSLCRVHDLFERPAAHTTASASAAAVLKEGCA